MSKHHHRPQPAPTPAPVVEVVPAVEASEPVKEAEPRWTLGRMTISGEQPKLGGMQIGDERVVLS